MTTPLSPGRWHLTVLMALGMIAPGLHAQPAPSRPDPLQASAPVPAARYTSAFSRYKTQTDIEVGSWRQANELTAQIGGWRAYAREAHAPDAPASSPAPISTPAIAPSASKAPAPRHQHSPARPQHHHGGQP